jgi:hypothetical protein
MVKELNSMLVKYGITKSEQIYHFLSQVMKESDDCYKKGLVDGVIKIGSNTYISSSYEGRKDLGNTQKSDGILFKGADIYTDIFIEYPQIKNMELLEIEMKVNKLLKEKAVLIYKDKDIEGLNLPIKTKVEYFSSDIISVKYTGYG